MSIKRVSYKGLRLPDDETYLTVRLCFKAICMGSKPAAYLLSALLFRYDPDMSQDMEQVKQFRIQCSQESLIEAMCEECTAKTIHDAGIPGLQLFGYLEVDESTSPITYTVHMDRIRAMLNLYMSLKKQYSSDRLRLYEELEKVLIRQAAPIYPGLNKKNFHLALEKVLMNNRESSNADGESSNYHRGRKPRQGAARSPKTATPKNNKNSINNKQEQERAHEHGSQSVPDTQTSTSLSLSFVHPLFEHLSFDDPLCPTIMQLRLIPYDDPEWSDYDWKYRTRTAEEVMQELAQKGFHVQEEIVYQSYQPTVEGASGKHGSEAEQERHIQDDTHLNAWLEQVCAMSCALPVGNPLESDEDGGDERLTLVFVLPPSPESVGQQNIHAPVSPTSPDRSQVHAPTTSDISPHPDVVHIANGNRKNEGQELVQEPQETVTSASSEPPVSESEEERSGPKEPDMSGVWTAEACVAYAQWRNEKTYTPRQADTQVSRVRSLMKKYEKDTRETVSLPDWKAAFDDWYAWWETHKGGLFHATDLYVEMRSGETRLAYGLGRIHHPAQPQKENNIVHFSARRATKSSVAAAPLQELVVWQGREMTREEARTLGYTGFEKYKGNSLEERQAFLDAVESDPDMAALMEEMG